MIKMPMYEIVGNNYKQQINATVVTLAAAGGYSIDIDLIKPGYLKNINAHMKGLTVANINNSIIFVYKNLPLPNAIWDFGQFCTQLRVLIYQPDAVARNVLISVDVVVD